jgi:serine/threonine protein kinase
MATLPGLQDFKLVKTLGKGAYGKVVAIRSKKTSELYAMKVVSKPMIQQLKMKR